MSGPGIPIPAVKDRPRCPNCDKPMRPWRVSRRAYKDGMFGPRVYEPWDGRYQGYGSFCSTPCCRQFANAAHRAGYRIKR